MKINSDNTTEAIKKVKPNLKDNSIKQYEIHLKKLKNLFESDNYDFLSEPNDVMEKIKDTTFYFSKKYFECDYNIIIGVKP
jgi:hypothetical protein